MKFQADYFKEVLIDNSDKAMIEYISIIMLSIANIRQKSTGQQPWFLIRTISQLTAILKDKSQSPITKFKTTKLIMYLLLMNEPYLYENFQNQLFSILKNDCFYNKSLQIQQRGLDFYKRNKYFDLANFQEREKIKIMGGKFIIFCLQIVYTLAKWIPLSAQNRQLPSTFGKAFQHLLSEGITFPQEQDFIFFNQQRIIQIDKNIKKIQKDVQQKKFSIKNTKYAKYSNRDSQLSEINSKDPEWLKNRLSEKDSLISQFKNNMEDLKQEKQLLAAHFQSQKKSYEQKLRSYQKKIQQLSYKIKRLKKRLKRYQNASDQYEDQEENLLMSNTSEVSQIMDLKDKIKFLIKENQHLRKQNQSNLNRLNSIQENDSKISKQLNLNARKKINGLAHEKILLAEQLLKQCKQNKQFIELENNYQNKPKDSQKKGLGNKNQYYKQLYEIKSSQQGLQPFYSVLKQQQQIRLRKCLLKAKQILHKDQFIEVGVKTKLINDITIGIQIIVTNISKENNCYETFLQNFKIQYVNRNKEVVVKIQKDKISRNKSNSCKFSSNDQMRQNLQIQVNNIDFKALLLKIDYQTIPKAKVTTQIKLQQKTKKSLGLIIPASKIKLLQFLPLTSKPKTIQYIPITKVIQLNKKVASSLSKLRQYLQGKVDSIKKQQNQNSKQSGSLAAKKVESPDTYKMSSSSKIFSVNQIENFSIKCKLLGSIFFLEFGVVDHLIKISTYHQKCNILAQKLSQQIVFILRK